jgi:hypothetical protein
MPAEPAGVDLAAVGAAAERGHLIARMTVRPVSLAGVEAALAQFGAALDRLDAAIAAGLTRPPGGPS